MNENTLYETMLGELKENQTLDSENILSTWIGDIDSNAVIMSDGYVSDSDFNIETREWFDCTKVGATTLTDPYTDISTGETVISIATPVSDEKGNTIVNEVVISLDRAVERVIIANEMIQKSAESAEIQLQNMNQIRDGVDEMSQSIQDNSAVAEETSATSEELAAQAVTLTDLVQQFELK